MSDPRDNRFRTLRRGLVGTATGAAGALFLTAVAAAPASADVPEGWPVAEPVDMTNMFLILGGIPVLLVIAIVAYVYLPAIVRGEDLAIGKQVPENQWIGGPAKKAGELEAPDDEKSAAGGASGSW